MSNKKSSKNNSSTICNSNYAKKINDIAHNQSPFGESEPSPHTTYK